MSNHIYSDDRIVQVGIETIERALNYIYTRIAPDKQGLDEVWYPRLQKWLLMVDHDAQLVAEEFLETELSGIQIRGEESTLSTFTGGLAALLDMLDGSDLLKRNLGNWCSAATILDASAPRIITALVGLPSREIYFTQSSNPTCAYVRTRDDNSADYQISEVRMSLREIRLRDASVCFYGQRPGRLTQFSSSTTKLGEWLRRVSEQAESKKREFDCPKMRIYTLAGNPMMISLIEGRVDAIVEISGQKCHDVVPGFMLALRAGAVLRDLSNKSITEEQITQAILSPASKFSYVLASSETLATEIVGLLGQP